MKQKSRKQALASFLLLVAAGTVSGCSRGTAGGPPPASPAVAAKAVAPSEPSRQWADMLDAFARVKAYRSRTVTVGGPAAGVTGEIVATEERVCPDRLRQTTKTDIMTTEIVVVGQDFYFRAEGGWSKDTLKPGGCDWHEDVVLKLLQNARNVKDDGRESRDGVAVQRVSFDVTVPPPAGTKGADSRFQCQLWVGAGDSLPRRLEKRLLGTDQVITTEFYDYNKDIRIEPPR